MNKIEELINKLCPDGVEFVKLKDIFDIRNGYTPSTKEKLFWENGTIPWFRLDDIRENGNILNNSIIHVTPAAIKGKINKANYLIISTTATIGVHALITVDSIANQQFTILNLNDNYYNKFNIKFLYYYFFKVDEYCLKILKNGAYNAVEMNSFKNIIIPLPPIEIQNEIVHILDTFTELITELKHRKIQYQYYLDNIFLCLSNPDSKECNTKFSKLINKLCPNGVEFVKLKDILKIKCGSNITKSELTSTGYPVISGGVSPLGYSSKYNNEQNKVTIARCGTAGYINYISTNFLATDKCYTLLNDKNKVISKYLFYVLKKDEDSIKKELIHGSIPIIKMSDLNQLEIPLPQLEIQSKIVNILDQFNDLTNSISLGLPKEIELRKQQYEYYRNKLLTFKQLEK